MLPPPTRGSLGTRLTGRCGPKMGAKKINLTISYRNLKINPYRDLCVTIDTLAATFKSSFFIEAAQTQAKRFIPYLLLIYVQQKMSKKLI